MTRRFAPAATATALILLLVAPLGWAENLPTDERIKTGTLENGVRWQFFAHDNPPGKMAAMIHIATGSLNETDEQRGLAHFLEHMAFNGSENFKPGELLPYFESLGMQFGADLNAFTGFDQTAYMLFLPDAKVETVDKALMTLSDMAFRQLLLPEEIDKERGVILSEKRAGMSAQQRIRDKLFEQLFEGTRLAVRLPIGTEEVISQAPREEFERYYRTWYRPERVTVFLVGDGRLEDYAPALQKWFGTYKSPVDPRPDLRADLKPFTRERAIVITDPEIGQASVDLYNLHPARPPVTTVELARTQLVEELGSWMIQRRFNEHIRKGQAAYLSAQASVSDLFNEAMEANVSVRGEPANWKRMLEEAIFEVNRAREHGFLPQEYDLAVREFVATAERQVRTESTRNANRVIMTLVRAVNQKEPVMSAQQELDMLNRLLPTIKLDEINAAFAANFKPGTFAYVVTLPEKPQQSDSAVPDTEEVIRAAAAAQEKPTPAWVWEDRPATILEKAPAPGKIVEASTDADLGITHAWLDNGVRVHHRYMDYKKDEVFVAIVLAGGEIEETAENSGVTAVAALAFAQPATSRLSSTDIQDILTGKNIRVMGGGQGDTFTVSVRGSPLDLEIGLELAHALLTDGRIEPSAFDRWRDESLQQWEMFSKVPQFRASQALLEATSGGDPRRTMMTPEKVRRQSLEAAQAWLTRLARTAPIEVAVVGDIELEAAMPLIEKYLGSLPARERSASHLDPLRRLGRQPGPLERNVVVETITPQAVVLAGFMGADVQNITDVRALNLAALILDTRLIKRIREELGIVYSISANSAPSQTYIDSGVFISGAPCQPGKEAEVIREIEAIFTAFAGSGPTEEELANARKQMAENLDWQLREPAYWFDLLRTLDLRRLKLDDFKTIREHYAAMTAEQVQAVFAKYYKPERVFRITARPGGETDKPAADASGAGAPGQAGS